MKYWAAWQTIVLNKLNDSKGSFFEKYLSFISLNEEQLILKLFEAFSHIILKLILPKMNQIHFPIKNHFTSSRKDQKFSKKIGINQEGLKKIIKKWTHKKGSLSCLVQCCQSKQVSHTVPDQYIESNSIIIIPKVSQKLSTCDNLTKFSHFSSDLLSNVNKHKKSMSCLRIQEGNNKHRLNYLDLIEDQDEKKKQVIFKANHEFFSQKQIHLNQVQEIKERIQKIKSQLIQNSFNRYSLKKSTLNKQKNSKIYGSKISASTQAIEQQQSQHPQTFIQELSIKDFEQLKMLGSGIYGQVSLYRHLKTNFLVAIKKISKINLSPTDDLTYLNRQLKIHSYVNHPNIVQLYTSFHDSDSIYLLMQVCQGNLLSTLQQSTNHMSEKTIKRYIHQISKALQYLHSNSIIHRDIKPENILVNDGVAKLCDFGWAIKTTKFRETLCGTPMYSSPQIVKKEKYDRKVDVWCLGIMTYELVFGKTPFDINAREQLYKVVEGVVQFPKNPRVSTQCINFIEGCLKKDPRQRFEIEQVLRHPFITKKKRQETK